MDAQEYKSRARAAVTGYYDWLRAEAEREARPKRKRDPDAPPTEHQEQRAVCQWLAARHLLYAANTDGVYYGHGNDAAIRGAIARRAGAKKGRPDIEVYTRVAGRPDIRGLAIEMKREKGGKVSPEQHWWHAQLLECGWLVRVCAGADEAIAWLSSLTWVTQ